jgi:hypothetical protein
VNLRKREYNLKIKKKKAKELQTQLGKFPQFSQQALLLDNQHHHLDLLFQDQEIANQAQEWNMIMRRNSGRELNLVLN